ncbi:hypothetical protein WJU23_04050 [Prosthecobacter sp. SYSU 5D2]|uniref:hypothetical protein n=1 Tax=Prosthecobacter sp. SYSU 5D2 TaxID=3134134 RepID=UPI0031FE519A
MKSFLLFSFLVLTMMLSTAAGQKSPKLPAFPTQPNINIALNQLNLARQKADGNPVHAIVHLQKANISLKRSANNKGSFRATAQRLADQAIKHLEKGEKDTAKKEIEDAIKATVKAGEASAK